MEKKTIFNVIFILILVIISVSFFVYKNAVDSVDEIYEETTEYPLRAVDIDDTSSYMLVQVLDISNEKLEIITDTQEIKANVSAFCVINNSSNNETSLDGIIVLYKDGEQIDSILLENSRIEYGTLNFREINTRQYQLLLGAEIVEQGENYTILCKADETPYYYSFAHGNDLESLEAVYLLNSGSSLEAMARPKLSNGEIVEFVEPSDGSLGYKTTHWYLRLSDYKLSDWYWDVKAVKDNLIVYAASRIDGGKSRIIIHDMFSETTDYQEITGSFPSSRSSDFLLSAEFTADGNLSATYTGKDGKVHTEIFALN